MTFYVYSKADSDSYYCKYAKDRIEKKVLIKAGFDVDKKRYKEGVLTIVSDEDMVILKDNKSFMRHVENGFITYSKESPEKEL